MYSSGTEGRGKEYWPGAVHKSALGHRLRASSANTLCSRAYVGMTTCSTGPSKNDSTSSENSSVDANGACTQKAPSFSFITTHRNGVCSGPSSRFCSCRSTAASCFSRRVNVQGCKEGRESLEVGAFTRNTLAGACYLHRFELDRPGQPQQRQPHAATRRGACKRDAIALSVVVAAWRIVTVALKCFTAQMRWPLLSTKAAWSTKRSSPTHTGRGKNEAHYAGSEQKYEPHRYDLTFWDSMEMIFSGSIVRSCKSGKRILII